MLQRRAFLLSGTVFMLSSGAGRAEDMAAAIADAFEAGQLPGLHGAIFDQGGDRLAEVYFKGEDESWGQPLGVVTHGPEVLHDCRSVTKSVVGLLYGIALDAGLVPPPDAPLLAQFPEYPDLVADPKRAGITVGHALSMQMGLLWDESLPYSDPRNSEIAMELAEDRYRFVLEQPVVAPPGGDWTYSGGAVAVLAAVIARGAGMPLEAFAAERLFAPLGITEFEWVKGRDGVASAASGLRLRLPDLVKLGQLIVDRGKYGDVQVVSEGWLQASFTPRVKAWPEIDYGYLWYLAGGGSVVFGLGNGGQRLTVWPEREAIVASFAGRYNDPGAWETSFGVIRDFALPVLRASK